MDQLNDLVFFFCAMLTIAGYALFHSLSRSQESMLLAAHYCCAQRWPVGRAAALPTHGNAHERQAAAAPGHGAAAQTPLGAQTAAFHRCVGTDLAPAQAHLEPGVRPDLRALGLRYSVLYLVLRGWGGPAVDPSFLVQMLSLSAGQFSLLPGGAGAAELTSATLLTPLVGSTAAAAILIWRG
jgi:hypothetical protein